MRDYHDNETLDRDRNRTGVCKSVETVPGGR